MLISSLRSRLVSKPIWRSCRNIKHHTFQRRLGYDIITEYLSRKELLQWKGRVVIPSSLFSTDTKMAETKPLRYADVGRERRMSNKDLIVIRLA